jgi:hypothetical protein
MKKDYGLKRVLLICFFSVCLTTFLSVPAFGQVFRVTIDKLLESLDHPQLLILDVRTTANWKANDSKIKGAVRKRPGAFDSWSDDLPKNKLLVLY